MDPLYDVQHGSFLTPSAELQSSGDSCRIPGATDIRRLMRLKAEQEQRLKSVTARVKLLNLQEDQAWKDVKTFRQRGNQADAAEWQRQVRKEEQRQLQHDLQEYHEALRERAQHVRAMTADSQAPRRQKFEENKQMAQQVREDSRRLLAALRDVREQSRQSKVVQVELRRQQKKQQQLRKNLEATRREQVRQDMNAMRFAELQQEVQQVQQALAEVEQEEAITISRMQNSQSIREELGMQIPAAATTSPSRGPSRGSSEILPPESTVIQADLPATSEPEVTRAEAEATSRPGSGALRGSGSLRGSGHLRSNSATSAPRETGEQVASPVIIHGGQKSGGSGAVAPTSKAPKPQVKAKQPKGYNFSPRSRKSTAGGAQRPDANAIEAAAAVA